MDGAVNETGNDVSKIISTPASGCRPVLAVESVSNNTSSRTEQQFSESRQTTELSVCKSAWNL